MTEQQFRLSLFAYLAAGVAWVISAWATIFIFNDSLGQLSQIKNWLPFMLVLGALILPSLIVTWSLIVEMTTTFSTNGISRLTLLGRKQITWGEIENLQIGIFYIDIKLSRSTHRIPLLMYRNPTGLVNYIHEQHTGDSSVL